MIQKQKNCQNVPQRLRTPDFCIIWIAKFQLIQKKLRQIYPGLTKSRMQRHLLRRQPQLFLLCFGFWQPKSPGEVGGRQTYLCDFATCSPSPLLSARLRYLRLINLDLDREMEVSSKSRLSLVEKICRSEEYRPEVSSFQGTA